MADYARELERRICQDRHTTAYPLDPSEWAAYSRPGDLQFGRSGRLSFYLHVPFCEHLCRFCEYTRCRVPSEEVQGRYLDVIGNDIDRFISRHPDILLEGLDIGGGTPTSLSLANFDRLMKMAHEIMWRLPLTADFEPSIEATFHTLTPERIRMIADAGFRRVSLGVQSTGSGILGGTGRDPALQTLRRMAKVIDAIRAVGDFKINLDFMYGFEGHGSVGEGDFHAVRELCPEQVTLYELRTNQLSGYGRDESPDSRFRDYARWHDFLVGEGYHGEFGRNTFSLDATDFGVSSYLRHRMLEGADYKGFGISAQSMSGGGVAYNVGKNHGDLLSLIDRDSYDAVSHYGLPPLEKFAKFVCVSSYSGGFDRRVARERFVPDFDSRFGGLVDFLVSSGLVSVSGDRIVLTRLGFRHYGAVMSLFYR